MNLRTARKIAKRVGSEPVSAPVPYTDAQEGQAARRLNRFWRTHHDPFGPRRIKKPGKKEKIFVYDLERRARRRRHFSNKHRRREGQPEHPLPPAPLWGSLRPFSA